MSFDLDSIAAKGKFPRFIVNTYRWGDKFFNGYDTSYVKPTGYRMNVKLKSDSWLDSYIFRLRDNVQMNMVSQPSTSLGIWLTYMAVSVGYDMNLSKYYNGSNKVRKRFEFQFNCSLFAANMSYEHNDAGATITSIKNGNDSYNTHINFPGINNDIFMFNAYYFFNHKRYSYAAAFSFGREQVRSAGSFFLGYSYWRQNYSFNFSHLPWEVKQLLPTEWENYTYRVKSKNYGIKIGYAYNWYIGRHWTLAVSESPTFGLSKGLIRKTDERKYSFSMYNTLRLSAIWNNRRLFGGVVGRVESAIVYDKIHTLVSSTVNLELTIGYRFNPW